MATLLEQLRERRTLAREAIDQILTRAAEEQRDLTAEEAVAHREHVAEKREAADRIEEAHARELAELRAAQGRRGPVLSRQALDTARAFRSAIFAAIPSRSRSTPTCPTSGPTTCPSR